jgi:hypothetical protein
MELARYELDLVSLQEGSWDKGGALRTRECIFFNGTRNENHQLGTGFFCTVE